jgi:hypothetical protein
MPIEPYEKVTVNIAMEKRGEGEGHDFNGL